MDRKNTTSWRVSCEDCLRFLGKIPDRSVDLCVSSPPYGLGNRQSESSAMPLADYTAWQAQVISECARVLADHGSLCWQVGHHIDRKTGERTPLDVPLFKLMRDAGLYYQNRIIWMYRWGHHARNRLSGRYEVILWFTKKPKGFIWNLDEIRVPQLYPDKRDSQGNLTCNPKGANPGDIWIIQFDPENLVWDIPNIRHGHPEWQSGHDAQFPIEIPLRLLLAFSEPGALVIDPFVGTGQTGIAAAISGRSFAGCDISAEFCRCAQNRIGLALNGCLPIRSPGPTKKPN